MSIFVFLLLTRLTGCATDRLTNTSAPRLAGPDILIPGWTQPDLADIQRTYVEQGREDYRHWRTGAWTP